MALTIDTSPPAWPPNALLIRGTANISVVPGVFPEYITGAIKVITADQFPQWQAEVEPLYDQMVRIEVMPTWAVVHDFETRMPKAVEKLAREKLGDR